MKMAYTKDQVKELISKKEMEKAKPIKYSRIYIERVIRYYVRLFRWLYQMEADASTKYLLKSLEMGGEESLSPEQLEIYRKYFGGSIQTLKDKIQELKESEMKELIHILRRSSQINVEQYLYLIDSSRRAVKTSLFDDGSKPKATTKFNLYDVQETICTFYSEEELNANERRKEALILIKDTLAKFYRTIDPGFVLHAIKMDATALNIICNDENIEYIADTVFLKLNYVELQEVEEQKLYDWIKLRIEQVITFRFIEEVFLTDQERIQAAENTKKQPKYSRIYIERIIRYYVRLLRWLYQVGANASTKYLLKSLEIWGEESISPEQLEVYRKYFGGSIQTLKTKIQELKKNEMEELSQILAYSIEINVEQYLYLIDSSGRAAKNSLFDEGSNPKTSTELNLIYVKKTICTFYSKRALNARERRKEARILIKDTLAKFYRAIDPDFDFCTNNLNATALGKIFTEENIERIADTVFLKLNYFELQEAEEYMLYDWIKRRVEKVITFRFIENVFLANQARMQEARNAKMQSAC